MEMEATTTTEETRKNQVFKLKHDIASRINEYKQVGLKLGETAPSDHLGSGTAFQSKQ